MGIDEIDQMKPEDEEGWPVIDPSDGPVKVEAVEVQVGGEEKSGGETNGHGPGNGHGVDVKDLFSGSTPPPKRSPGPDYDRSRSRSRSRTGSPGRERSTKAERGQTGKSSSSTPARAGPILIDDLPTAWDEAHETFTSLEKCVYERKDLGLSRESDEMMVCDCVFDKRECARCVVVRASGCNLGPCGHEGHGTSCWLESVVARWEVLNTEQDANGNLRARRLESIERMDMSALTDRRIACTGLYGRRRLYQSRSVHRVSGGRVSCKGTMSESTVSAWSSHGPFPLQRISIP